MNNVIHVTFAKKEDKPVNTEITSGEYLEMCKEELEVHDYERVLCALMDKEYYEFCSETLKRIVQNYIKLKIKEEKFSLDF